MVSLMSLWLPIVLAAALVFVASSIIHMVLGYHNTDFGKVRDEDGVMNALRPFEIPPGDYVVPCAGSMKVMNTPEFLAKLEKGPVLFMNVFPPGMPGMGKNLVLWFVYCLVVGVFAAYLTGRALGPGAEYLEVFRFAGTVAFTGYALALWQSVIWMRRSVVTTLKSTFDGLIYALLTAGTFGWLWPGA